MKFITKSLEIHKESQHLLFMEVLVVDATQKEEDFLTLKFSKLFNLIKEEQENLFHLHA